MEIILEKRNIQSNFEGEELNYQIDANGPHFFNLLRKQIYSDPKGAICREITDNARDAHREVNTPDRPVEITMPGSYLVIRDFGPGMSPERVGEVYRYYGRSTKRADNKQGGGFGLGSKTPFAYADQFWVETIVNGTKYVWLNFIDESGCGKLKLVSESQTNEEHGTSVKIPIKTIDQREFYNKILFYTRYWHCSGDATPKYLGALVDPPPKPTMEGDGWLILNNNDTTIIVNGIPYKVDRHNFKLPSGTVLLMPTGSVDLAAHREQIHFSDRTNSAIQAASKKMWDDITQFIEKKADSLEFYQLVDIIDKFNIKQKLWTWRGHTVKIPLDQYLNVRIGYYGRTQYSNWTIKPNEKTISISHEFKDSNGVIIDSPSSSDISSYEKSKIRHYIQKHDKEALIVHPNNVLCKILPTIKLDDIKITRTPSSGPPTPRVSRKGKIKIYNTDSGYISMVDCDNKGDRHIYFCMDKIKRYNIQWPDISMYYFSKYAGVQLIAVQTKDEHKLQGNWIKYEDYKREYFKDFPEPLQKEVAQARYLYDIYNKFNFLKSHPDFQFLDWKTKYKDLIKQYPKFIETLSEEAVCDIYKKYPMLEYVPNTIYSDNYKMKRVIEEYVKEKSNV